MWRYGFAALSTSIKTANSDVNRAKAQAEALKLQALADSQITDPFARELALRRVEVERIRAYGSRTV